MEVIIIDSISQCWDNLLEYHANLQGNSFTNWQKITPRMNAFMQKILQSPSHVICTMRCKQDYVLSEKNGKMIPEKVGLKAVMRDGIDYEFTIVLDINMKHQAIASKDRTSLFTVSYTHLGMTSHAAVVARGMGKCCVSGAGALNIDYKARTVEVDGVLLKEGDFISLNGSTGEVYQGKVETKAAELSGDFADLMKFCLLYTSRCV